MHIKNKQLLLRTIESQDNGDIEHIYQWLNDARILKYFGGRDTRYSRTDLRELFRENVYEAPVMILYKKKTIGFINLFQFTDSQKQRHGLAKHSGRIFAVDIVIGDVAYQNRGIGRQALMMILGFIFEELGADKVVLDTYPWHTQALRCYESCGFTITRTLDKHEQYEGQLVANVFMEIDKGTFQAGKVQTG